MPCRQRYVELVRIGRPHITSRAAYVKLCRQLAVEDGSELYWKHPDFRKNAIKKVIQEKGELRCFYCYKELVECVDGMKKEERLDRMVTLDHVKPQAHGGGKYDPNNVVLCCHACNNLKADMSIEEFIKLLSEKVSLLVSIASFLRAKQLIS